MRQCLGIRYAKYEVQLSEKRGRTTEYSATAIAARTMLKVTPICGRAQRKQPHVLCDAG
jgi:hypothetical protein